MKTHLLILMAAVSSVVGLANAAELQPATKPGPLSLSAGGHSMQPVFAADGRHLAFVSLANNLVTNDDTREWLDLFVHDLTTSNTVLASVSAAGFGGRPGNCSGAVLSSNGQFVAFSSDANNLVSGDTNGASDVFVRDQNSGVTHLVSITLAGIAGTNDVSANPLISSDGRWVFFEGTATNLVPPFYYYSWPGGYNWVFAGRNIYRRDLLSNTTTLVSVSWTNNPFIQSAPFNTNCELTGISADAGTVAFIIRSGPTALSAAAVYVRNMASNGSVLVSAAVAAYTNTYRCPTAQLSADGRYVAYIASGLPQGSVLFRHDLETNVTTAITTNVAENSSLHLSSTGRYVTFEDGTNVLRWDGDSNVMELVSTTTLGATPASGISRGSVATPDGNHIVFVSSAPGLTSNTLGGTWQLFARDMAAGVTRLLSVATNGGPSAGVDHYVRVAVTPDFARVAFDTAANDLVPGDRNRASDVFVRELATETTTLVSKADPSLPRLTGLNHALVGQGCLSADGRYLTFSSLDSDLLPDDTNIWSDVFIRDLWNDTVTTVGFGTNSASLPVISGDGRYVAYMRVPPMNGGASGGQLYRTDRFTGTNQLIGAGGGPIYVSKPSINTNGSRMATSFGTTQLSMYSLPGVFGTNQTLTFSNVAPILIRGENQDAVFTPDSRYLFFASWWNYTNNYAYAWSIFAFDLISNTFQVVSIDTRGFHVSSLGTVAVNQNSRYVAFASSGVFAGILRHDLQTGISQSVADLGKNPSISADGRYVAYERTDVVPAAVYLFDCDTGVTTLVANSLGYSSTSASCFPALSADARFVTFRSRPNSSSYWSVVVRDLLLGTSNWIGSASANLSVPAPSPDGRTLAISSVANDLAPGDYNDKRDVFILQLGVDTDGDGLDDDWEAAYFSTLARDGDGDFDSDGLSDRAEFLAGTDPTNGGSVFRVLTLTPAGGGSRNVVWTGNPSRAYRVEFKDNLNAATWRPLNAAISWNGANATATDSSSGTNRYYRVVRMP